MKINIGLCLYLKRQMNREWNGIGRPPKELDVEAIKKYIDMGIMRSKICEEFGITYPTLRKIVGPSRNRINKQISLKRNDK